MSLNEDYNAKDRGYFQNIRTEILDRIPQNTQRLLEIGCGEGVMARAAKEYFAIGEVVGVEYNEQSAEIAQKHLDTVLCGNIETMQLPFPEKYFDVIICADVLEHLTDPWATLNKLTTYLNVGGIVVISIPNIAYRTVVRSIARDRFEYQDYGIMDRTHLRFFTRSTILAMIQSAGLFVIHEHKNIMPGYKQFLWKIFTLGYHKHSDVIQFIFTAKKQ